MVPPNLATRLRDRLVQSRFLTISLTLHLILVLILGTVMVVRPLSAPPEFVAPGELVQRSADPVKPAPQSPQPIQQPRDFTPSAPGWQQPEIEDFIRKTPTGLKEPVVVIPSPGQKGGPDPGFTPVAPPPAGGLSKAQLDDIREFTDWRTNDRSASNPAFEFTAYVGRYGGNWNSTVRVSKGEITAGSLPNLLYVTSRWTKERIKTNERNVKAIPLDSDEIFVTKPPFIFLTGTQDFTLTDKEIENLRLYIRLGGAIWGDSSVPGRRSAFDMAFRREMERVIGGKDNQFAPLPENDPVLARGYFPKVRALPAGINHYRDPVQVLRWHGEIAVIHTTNDYGDMWQIGLDKDGRIDLSRNKEGQYVAMNDNLWTNRGVYVRNIDQPAVEQAYKFGINMIVHLLTRWESRTANSAPL
jgi:hypothetical protein